MVMKKLLYGSLISATMLMLGGCGQQSSGLHSYISGQLDAQANHTDQAIAELNAAIEKNPQLELAYQALGDLYLKKGDFHQAAASFQRASEINPWSFHNFYSLGLTRQELREFVRAIGAYQRALEIKPKSAQASIKLAVAYAQDGKPFMGLIYGKRAIADGSNSFSTWVNLGAIYSQAADTDPSYRRHAIHYYKQSLELQPHQSAIYLNLAGVYIAEKRFDTALHVLATGEKLAPSPAIDERMGYCQYSLGHLAAATAKYKAALKQFPNYTPAINGLGVVDMAGYLKDNSQTDLKTQALNLWLKSLSINPNQPMIRQLLKHFGH